MKLHTLYLTNFKGFKKCTFEFREPISLLYGPNGIGKSSVLEAISLIANPRIFHGRSKDDVAHYLRPLIWDADYSLAGDRVAEKPKLHLDITGDFRENHTLGRGHCSAINNSGIIASLKERHGSYCFYVDADNASNLAKFQLRDIEADKFVELAEAIYGYPVDLDGEVKDSLTGEDGVKVEHLFYNDMILHKGDTKVHFGQMSAGEKKIATLIRQLCNPDNVGDRDIILIDNIEMHVYYKRHKIMLDKLMEMFVGKQIIATTHSPLMIEHVGKKSRYDLEKYKPEYAMGEKSKCRMSKTADEALEEMNRIGNLSDEEWRQECAADATMGPGSFEEFLASVKENIKSGNYRRNRVEGHAYQPSAPANPVDERWISKTLLGDPVRNISVSGDKLQRLISEAIIINLDEDGQENYDPLPNQYVPGMLRPNGKRQPPSRPDSGGRFSMKNKKPVDAPVVLNEPYVPDLTVEESHHLHAENTLRKLKNAQSLCDHNMSDTPTGCQCAGTHCDQRCLAPNAHLWNVCVQPLPPETVKRVDDMPFKQVGSHSIIFIATPEPNVVDNAVKSGQVVSRTPDVQPPQKKKRSVFKPLKEVVEYAKKLQG